MQRRSTSPRSLLLGLVLWTGCTTTSRELKLEALTLTEPTQGITERASERAVPSPVDPGSTLIERDHDIWLRQGSGPPRPLTADSSGRYRFAELFARQREGEVILYWAVDPMWSPDGKLVSYLTNRASVLDGGPGQEVWTVEVASGLERPLLSTPGRSYRHAGWLGGELLFFGDAAPGVWAVDPATGAQRAVSNGYVSATTRDGSAVAITRGDSVVVLSKRGAVPLPAPPAGHRYAADAEFSPSGRRLAMLLSDRRGGSLVRVFEPASGRSATLAYPDTLSPTHRPMWRDEAHLELECQVWRPQHPDASQRRGETQALVVKVSG